MNKSVGVKNLLSAVMVLSACTATTATAADLKVGIGYDHGLSAVMQFNERVNLAVGSGSTALDVLFNKGGLTGSAVWYVGAGGWLTWNDNDDEFGLRIPLGIEAQLLPRWEIYGQIHPQLKFKDNNNKGNDTDLGIGAALGLRYQF